MCGIAGLWSHNPTDLGAVDAMAGAIQHRGPDDVGTFEDADAGLVLGFRRLAIVDLSATGHQPMTSSSGRWVIVFNGEIYNFRDLTRELASRGATFRGSSDTEVILAGVEAWGVDGLWERLWGMFAIALWDTRTKRLYLVRDRLGKKPLYYGVQRGHLLFGSELKALQAHASFDAAVDRDSLAAYLRYGYVPAPRSIFEGIYKVPAGSVLTFDAPCDAPVTTSYWTAFDQLSQALTFRDTAMDATSAEEELDVLLRDAVSRRMVADVPLGAFLSGGIDSSVVTALMAAQSPQRVRTFTVGFGEGGYDEAHAAREVASVLGTDHTELQVTAEQARDVIPRLPHVYDEPFADSSQIPTLLVAELARRHVTVALSGDGGDEVFGGYVRYQGLPAAVRNTRHIPRPARRALAAVLRGLPPSRWNAVLEALSPLLPRSLRQARPGEKLHKLATVLEAPSVDAAYLATVSCWQHPASLVRSGHDLGATWDVEAARRAFPDTLDRLMAVDLVSYLPDDILAKVDRATMAVSLEARAPLLDHRVVEWAWRQPQRFKISEGRGKWLLRRVLSRYVPPALFERPKMGFGVPVGEWLRGPLRPWAEALLEPARLAREGYLSPDVVRRTWQQHLAGQGAHEHRLWTVLMFQAWLEGRR